MQSPEVVGVVVGWIEEDLRARLALPVQPKSDAANDTDEGLKMRGFGSKAVAITRVRKPEANSNQ
jgi:hypothetical protein